ncbi:MAG TPA: UDP-N-acetylmuramoyl-tripeptide--D-alanyl-D-alanine ligase [Gemmatimonadaceae bacterium]|jgi:UDP-N-acetylmuramoyl-tripeptide--D-alanyl-D-alanine ligase
MTFWTLDRVADALQPIAKGNLPRGAAELQRVWTDTRTITRGDLFVALVGERFDAHEFLPQAVASGAAAVVVSRVEAARGLGVPVFDVRDTLVALGSLGRYRRCAWNKPVVAVVGTNGKTSTKELLKAALGSGLEAHATQGNLNNLVGVPLTLLALPDHADIAVVEMGTNQPGEVARLRAIIEPNITVVTSIAEEHLEGLGDLAGVMREELAACDGVPTTIVPAAQPDVAEAARKLSPRVVTAGLDSGDLKADRWKLEADGRGSIVLGGIPIEVPLRGVHNLRNTMLALAVSREAGVPFELAARGIQGMQLPPMRSNVEQIGRVTLVNDAYNSNPGSARAALELLHHAGHGRQRVAVLGTMLELGPSGPTLHETLAREALASPIEVIAGLGEFAAALERVGGGGAANRVVTASDVESLWNRLSSRLEPDAVILLKASRGVRLEQLVPKIKEWVETRTR